MSYETIFKNAVKKIMRRMVDEDTHAPYRTYVDFVGEGNPTKLVEDVMDVLGIVELEPEHTIWDWAVEVLEEFENND